MKFYLGTYTRFGGAGVLMCERDGDELRVLATDALPDATYVILNRAKTRLFAVSSCNVDGRLGGSAASYDISGGALKRISHKDAGGDDPCFLCLSADERYLYTANYADGSLSVFPIKDGTLGERIQVIRHEGHGVNPARQQAPHVHQVTLIPSEDRLCAVDLGTDELVTYDRDSRTGLLTRHDTLRVPDGLGPRHICYGADGLAYLAHELESRVSVLRRQNGAWELMQTLPTLPSPDPHNTVAAIRLRGGRLYVSNRGDNSIAAYDVGRDGLLSFAALIPTGDDFPRDFDFADDNTVLIAHQKGGVLLSRLSERELKPISRLDVRGAVCVCVQA